MGELQEKMRHIPSIDCLLEAAEKDDILSAIPHTIVADILREATAAARMDLKQGKTVDTAVAAMIREARKRLREIETLSLRRVVNATGVVLHTNLGRAPLSPRAVAAVQQAASCYSTLEYNVASGERGSRYDHVARRLCLLSGSEDAIAVNNNAAAVLLVLSAIASGKEVIVSRGELVEIGGSFRVPDVLRQSGAILVEVGTTNKTHLHDYQNAISPNTAAILKVHTSNYRIVGFTSQPGDRALVQLAHAHNLPVIEDLGSGTLLPLRSGNWQEPSVQERMAAGMDVVTFSGDKLLGAGQAGMIAGKKAYIDKMKKHPLLRAIRIDKLSLAALEGTLIDYQLGSPADCIPVHKLLNVSEQQLREYAERLAGMLSELNTSDWTAEVLRTESQAGGGSLPGVGLPSWGVAIRAQSASAAQIERRFRQREIPIIVRIQDEKIIFDVRCLTVEDMSIIREACREWSKGE